MLFENNPAWVYIAPDKFSEYGFWAKVGGRTDQERSESRSRLEAWSKERLESTKEIING
jgi:hypothetical protein